MKYEKPELTALTSAVSAIQNTEQSKRTPTHEDGDDRSIVPSYSDWE
jgi:hypothetical protein